MPSADEIFRRALRRSTSPAEGLSFRDVAREFDEEMRSLGCRATFVSNDVGALQSYIEHGTPIIAGYQVSSEIEAFHRSAAECSARGFILPAFSGRKLSAHCVLLIGWDEAVLCFLARNSWGTSWGVDGHFLVSFASVANKDFFTDLLIIKSKPAVEGA